jgi:predicted acyltransferase
MRLTSLDVFRGVTIAGMILVNMVSLAEPDVYPALLHADWHGCTLADLVFPFFLFIVGVAMSFSLAKYTDVIPKVEKGRDAIGALEQFLAKESSAAGGAKPPYKKIFRRAAILFALGLLLNLFWNSKTLPYFDFSTLRIMGVLQRIALTYLFASLIVLKLPRKTQWAVAGVLLVGYWLLMMYVPVPEYGAGEIATRTGNFAAYIDRFIIPKAHLYKGDGFNYLGDPEGVFSTIPAIVSVLAGYFSGQWIRNQPVKTRTSLGLALVGVGCLILAWLFAFDFPINKKLWTSSYVLFTTGWALLLLAGCYELIEVQRIRSWAKPFEVLGMNAIAIFIASVLLIKILAKTIIGTGDDAPNLYTVIYKNLFASWAGGLNGSFLFAFVTVLLWLGVAWIMYRQRLFIKI